MHILTQARRRFTRVEAAGRRTPYEQLHRRGRVWAYTLVLAAAVTGVVVTGSRPAGAQPAPQTPTLSAAAFDSVRAALESADWNDRHGALLRLNAAYPDALPTAIKEPILSLLSREASDNADHAGDEDFGEYIVDLVLTGVNTGDPRAIPAILQLGGLGISSGVAAFVASQGATVMPTLDALARTREDRASDVVETYALMYARYGSRLTRDDSVQVLRRLIAVAGDTSSVVRAQLALVAPRGPISELLPALADLVASDPEQLNGVYIVRQAANEALPVLRQARAAFSTGELLNRLTLLTAAACDGADVRLQGQCTALAAHLGTAVRSAASGQTTPALAALAAFQQTARRLGADGLVPRPTAVTLDGTAQAVADRLEAGR